ncbi:MAG: hypothetical protein ACR2IJ_10660 [Fluviibacter sp.]
MKHQLGYIIHLAKVANFDIELWKTPFGCEAKGTHEELERFANLCFEIEREACARLCEDEAIGASRTHQKYSDHYAAVIRARGQE